VATHFYYLRASDRLDAFVDSLSTAITCLRNNSMRRSQHSDPRSAFRVRQWGGGLKAAEPDAMTGRVHDARRTDVGLIASRHPPRRTEA
jgi:hypothetical protein